VPWLPMVVQSSCEGDGDAGRMVVILKTAIQIALGSSGFRFN
jgi:hypothetical protein